MPKVNAGLSKPRLELLPRVLSGYVDRKEVPGLVALVSHHDDVHLETLGALAIDHAAPMNRDTIFRIASLAKPVTAAAAMILVEECKLRLDESIETWLPELANRRVLKSMSSQPDETVLALRPITVRDLLTFRMGFGSVMAMPDTYPIQKLIREYRIGGDGPPLPAHAPGTDEWLKKLGSLPWMAQPGERWMYHVSADVLGVLIARVSGHRLGTFMRERIFDPLGMKDTGFHVPSQKIARFPDCYRFNRRVRRRGKQCMAARPAVRIRRRRPRLDHRRLFRLQPHDAEQGAARPRADSFARHREPDDLRPAHARATPGFRDLLRRAQQLGIRDGSGHRAKRDLPEAWTVRLDRRSRHLGVHRSCGRDDRHPLYAADDGFAGSTEGFQRFLDAGLRRDGIVRRIKASAVSAGVAL